MVFPTLDSSTQYSQFESVTLVKTDDMTSSNDSIRSTSSLSNHSYSRDNDLEALDDATFLERIGEMLEPDEPPSLPNPDPGSSSFDLDGEVSIEMCSQETVFCEGQGFSDQSELSDAVGIHCEFFVVILLFQQVFFFFLFRLISIISFRHQQLVPQI